MILLNVVVVSLHVVSRDERVDALGDVLSGERQLEPDEHGVNQLLVAHRLGSFDRPDNQRLDRVESFLQHLLPRLFDVLLHFSLAQLVEGHLLLLALEVEVDREGVAVFEGFGVGRLLQDLLGAFLAQRNEVRGDVPAELGEPVLNVFEVRVGGCFDEGEDQCLENRDRLEEVLARGEVCPDVAVARLELEVELVGDLFVEVELLELLNDRGVLAKGRLLRRAGILRWRRSEEKARRAKERRTA